MSQQSIFISDGAGSGNNASVSSQNGADGGFALEGLVAQYNSTPPTLTDGNLSFLQVDANGNLKTANATTISYAANDGAALPSQAAWIGGSDGVNLQGLEVESATFVNLKTSLWYGGNEMIVGNDGYTAVHQADSPWVVSGTVAVSSVGGTVAVTQSTSPWVVSGTVAATQSGTWTVEQGTPPWSVVGTYASNVAAGSDAVKGLVGRYQSSPTMLTDGNLTYLQTDAYGKLLTTATLSPSFVAPDNTALPADAAWIGASDGTNLQGLEVESASFANLKVGLWDGANKLTIGSSPAAAGNGAHVMPAQFNATGAATAVAGPVDGYRFADVAVADTNVSYAQTDGYGRLEMSGARAIAYAYENRTNQTITLKNTAGVLRKVIVGNAGKTGALLTFYDNTAASGTIIAKINTSSILGQLVFDIPFAVGLTYTTNAPSPAADVTITFE